MQEVYDSLCKELDAALKQSQEQLEALPVTDSPLVTKDEIKADAKALSEQTKAAAAKGGKEEMQKALMTPHHACAPAAS